MEGNLSGGRYGIDLNQVELIAWSKSSRDFSQTDQNLNPPRAEN